MAREMKDSGVEWIGEIPQNYNIYRLKHLIKRNLDYGANASGVNYSNDLPRYIRITDIGADGKLKTEGALSLEFEDANPYILKEGDILFARSGATVGKSFIYHTEYGKAAFAGYLIRAQLKEEVVPQYIYYYTCSAGYDIWKNGIFIQSTIQNISADKYANLPIVLPETEDEQNRIVRFLKHKCSELDNVFQKTCASIEEYKKLKQAVITQAVTKGVRGKREMKDSGIDWLNELPVEWKPINPKALFTQRKDKALYGEKQLTASQQYGIIYQSDYMERTGTKVVTVEKDFDILKHVELGDFVISMRSFQGGLEYSELSGSISSAYVMLKPNLKLVYSGFYRWLLKSEVYIRALQSTSNLVRDGQAMRYSNFAQIKLFVPPMDEQKEIAEYLDKECAIIDKLIQKKEQYLTEIENYKKSLIYEYVTGKKEVPEINYKLFHSTI